MKKTLLALMLAGGSLFGQVSLGITFGAPPPPRVIRNHPRSPGPGYVWVDGYWYPNGRKYKWHDGYWTRPPFDGGAWVGPRYEGGKFFEGYWSGPGNRHVDHDHRWDHDKRSRDYDRH